MKPAADSKKSRRGIRGGLRIEGGVVPAGTIASNYHQAEMALTREERGRRALLALGELVLGVRDGLATWRATATSWTGPGAGFRPIPGWRPGSTGSHGHMYGS